MKLLFIQDTIDAESIGVAYISAALKNAGHTTSLIVASLERDIYEVIENFKPDIFLFPIIITKQNFFRRLGHILKNRYPDKKIIIGGPFVTLDNRIAEEGWVDYAVLGEGEEAVVELVNAIENGDSIRDIKNLVYTDSGQIIKNPLRRLVEDLDSLPMPDRELYFKYNSFRNLSVKRFLSGRGCPYLCNFCFNRRLLELYRGNGRYVRKHSVERVCEEIEWMRSRAVLRTVHFSDDIFFTNKKWIEEFSEIYPKKVGIPFQCNLTATMIDEDIIRMLKEAGIRGVGIGLESGVERIRKNILGKNFKNEEIENIAVLLHKYKIELYTYNMIALPGESIDDAIETLEINRRMHVKITQCNIAIPFEGLPLTEIATNLSLLSGTEDVLNMQQRPESPIINVKDKEMFERLFLLFPFLVKTNISQKTIRLLLRSPLNILYRILHKISYFLNMKRYYDIPFLSGFRIILDIKKGEKFVKRFFEDV